MELTKSIMELSVLKEFNEYPGLRHCSISENSGEEFYHKVLNKKFHEALLRGDKLVVILDNTAGYAPSFIDEAFGNLVYDFSKEVVQSNLKIISEQEPFWIERITNDTYPKWEARRIKSEEPKTTETHNPWFRKTNNGYELKQWS